MKKYLLCLALSFLAGGSAKADLFEGQMFNLSMNFSDATVTTFEDANPSIGPFTFADGTTVSAGTSLFDANVEIMVSFAETVINPFQSIVEVEIYGEDSAGNRVNPVGDGTVSATPTPAPFEVAWLDLGIFNGAPLGLQPKFFGIYNSYQIDASLFAVLNAAGEGGGFEPDFFSTAPDPIAASTGINFAGDLSTLDLNTVNPGVWTTPGEMVGWSAALVVTVVPVPEPNSLGFLGLIGIAAAYRRRK